ncbi:MAG: hypothetical protein QW232_10065 [Saccharolobus sp.]
MNDVQLIFTTTILLLLFIIIYIIFIEFPIKRTNTKGIYTKKGKK